MLHCNLVSHWLGCTMPVHLGQHWIRQWLIALWHLAISWSNVDLPSNNYFLRNLTVTHGQAMTCLLNRHVIACPWVTVRFLKKYSIVWIFYFVITAPHCVYLLMMSPISLIDGGLMPQTRAQLTIRWRSMIRVVMTGILDLTIWWVWHGWCQSLQSKFKIWMNVIESYMKR